MEELICEGACEMLPPLLWHKRVDVWKMPVQQSPSLQVNLENDCDDVNGRVKFK